MAGASPPNGDANQQIDYEKLSHFIILILMIAPTVFFTDYVNVSERCINI